SQGIDPRQDRTRHQRAQVSPYGLHRGPASTNTTPRLKGVLRDLNKIARKNGGNRAFGLPGYKASLDYVLDHVQRRYRKDFDTHVQSFTHLFATTNSI